MKFTLDASVYINAMNPAENGSVESQLLLKRLKQCQCQLFSPTLLLVEVTAATARALDNTLLAIQLAQSIYALPLQTWVSLDTELATEAAQLGAMGRLRGADAVYAAVAQHYETALITRDRQQLERLKPTLPVLSPIEALAQL